MRMAARTTNPAIGPIHLFGTAHRKSIIDCAASVRRVSDPLRCYQFLQTSVPRHALNWMHRRPGR